MAKGTAALARPDVDATTRLRITIGRLSRRLRRAAGEATRTPTEVAVLSTTARIGPVGLGRLAEAEGLNPTMLSRVVRSLEADGLLLREPDPDDRRAATVALTPGGAELVARIRTEKSSALDRALERIGEEGRSAVLGALPHLEALAEALREEGDP